MSLITLACPADILGFKNANPGTSGTRIIQAAIKHCNFDVGAERRILRELNGKSAWDT